MSNPDWDDKVDELLTDWRKRARDAQHAHHGAASRFDRRHYWVGIPAAIFSATVGTSVFYALENQVDTWVKIGVGSISVATAILTGLQTYLNSSERAEKHRTAAARYGALRSQIQALQAIPRGSRGEVKSTLDELLGAKNRLAEESPSVPRGIWEKSKAYEKSKAPVGPP